MGIRRILSYVLLAMITAMAVLYFMGHREEFHIIGTVSVGAVALLSVLQLFSGIFYGLQLKILTDHYKLNLNFFQWYGLIRATSFANLWLPFAAGASVKAIYLKKIHNLDYSSFIALTAVMNIIKFMVNSLFACILLLVTIRSAPLFLFAISFFIFAATFVFILLAHRISSRFLPSWDFVKKVEEEWRDIRKNRAAVVKLILVSCFLFLFSSAQVYVAFRAFSFDLSFLTGGIISAFTTITGAIALIPGNFGIREAIIVSISGIDGMGVNEGIHAAALIRITGIVWTLLLSSFSWYKFLDTQEDVPSSKPRRNMTREGEAERPGDRDH